MRKSAGNILRRFENAFAYSDMMQSWNTAINVFERTLQKTELWSYPFIVQVDVTNRCNLNCTFCSRHKHPLKLGNLSPDLIPKVIKFSRKSRELILFGYGEPLIAESFHSLLKGSRSGTVSFTTNGLLLTQEMTGRIIGESERPIHNITFSIDASRPETYLSIRERSDFHKVWNNLKKLSEYKERHQLSTPEIWINFVAMKRNIEELPGLIKQAADSGVSQVTVFHLIVWEEAHRYESLLHYPDLTRKVFGEARHIADELNVALDLPIEISMPHPNTQSNGQDSFLPRCFQPWSYFYLRYDGSVQACCFSDNLVMGNLMEQSFDEIWNDEPYRRLRATVNKSPIKDCRRCELRFRYTPSPNDLETYIKLNPRKK
jgi:MoaA/NifB/PqqE/SkfB family radical SAM enzyme